ncbi:MAG TPA: metallophosphoesterase [Kofleriaceae bacterium]|nr:metallophosphoesterase [Kofleriaceae bacterium]
MSRTLVMGDPQAPLAKLLAVLERHGALAGDRLADDVVLVSIGDHFDYDPQRAEAASREGLALLGWLAAHDPAQAVLLLGNHDAARVMELAAWSDADHALARGLDRDAFAARFPAMPPHGVLARDYAAFSVAQRELVQRLLLAGRFHLAVAAELADGRRALVSHAGVTARELALLAAPAEPTALATALDRMLADAIDRVRPAWQRGEPAALSLAPLHVAGGGGKEGGGLLYHRPSNPAAGSTFDPERPRRFDPRALPAGLTQVIGHSGHAKCVYELAGWCTDRARARGHGGIRTLRVAPGGVSYDLGVSPPAPGATDVILIDGELRRLPPDEVDLLPLARLDL